MSGVGVNLVWFANTQIRRNVIPIGLKNNVNLVYTLPDVDRASPGTLEVWLSCVKLTPDSFVLAPDFRSFTVVLDPLDPFKLNCPPQQNEPLFVDYFLLNC